MTSTPKSELTKEELFRQLGLTLEKRLKEAEEIISFYSYARLYEERFDGIRMSIPALSDSGKLARTYMEKYLYPVEGGPLTDYMGEDC